jgi:N-acetylglutamate synthase-like GNAT family acetyltransferase
MVHGAILYVPKAYRADVFTLDDHAALDFANYIIAASRPAEPAASSRRPDARPAIEFLTGGAQAIATMSPPLLRQMARKTPAHEVVNIVMHLPPDAPAGRVPGVRQARESDVPALMRWRRLYREERGLVFDADVEALVRSQRVFVYDHEGTVVAAAKLDIELATLVEIGGVYTFPSYRQRGYGGQIVRDLAARIRELGKTPVLQVDHQNTAALHLYQHLGWQPKGPLARVWLSKSG